MAAASALQRRLEALETRASGNRRAAVPRYLIAFEDTWHDVTFPDGAPGELLARPGEDQRRMTTPQNPC